MATVTAALSWLSWHWARLAGNPPAGMRVYSRAVARAAVTALVLWCLGVAATAVGYGLLPPAGPTPAPLTTPEPAVPPGTASPPQTGSVRTPPAASPPGLGAGEEEFEFTEQPELPPSLQAVMAAALAASGDSATAGPVIVLADGDVAIQSLDPASGRIDLLNRSGYSVDLGGWSISVHPVSGGSQSVWCNFAEGLVLGPGCRLRVLAGTVAREAAARGLGLGAVDGDEFVWTTANVEFGEVTLYDSAGSIRARLPGGAGLTGPAGG